jgi:hypothetical protein
MHIAENILCWKGLTSYFLSTLVENRKEINWYFTRHS